MPAAASELAREVVCAGFVGTTPEDAPLAEMRALGLRGAILFARNITTPAGVGALTSALQAALADDAPALIAIDQEGGPVARIRDGVVELPAMMALGATQDALLARRAGVRVGRDLASLGINLDFAPVLDLALEPRNTVIGTRSFGEDPRLVAELGSAFAQGLRESGIVAVGKHFPGHGATDVDSHFALPILSVDEATWRERELRAFAKPLEAGLAALMTAHVVLPALDPARPATLSRAIVSGVVREELKFDGVVFSDCLEMEAIARHFGSARAAPLALAAGVDCILFSHRLELARDAIAAIERAVDSGDLALDRLAEAAQRVRRLRESAMHSLPAADPQKDATIGLEIARAAVTVIRGRISVAERAAVTVVSFEDGERPSLSGALRQRGVRCEIMRVALEPSDDDLALLAMVLHEQPHRTIVVVTRRAHLHPPQAQGVRRILDLAPDAIVVSGREPYDVALFEKAHNVACVYDDGEVALEGLADVMTGRAPASHPALPVRLDGAAVDVR